jgi:hypothetical protein
MERIIISKMPQRTCIFPEEECGIIAGMKQYIQKLLNF